MRLVSFLLLNKRKLIEWLIEISKLWVCNQVTLSSAFCSQPTCSPSRSWTELHRYSSTYSTRLRFGLQKVSALHCIGKRETSAAVCWFTFLLLHPIKYFFTFFFIPQQFWIWWFRTTFSVDAIRQYCSVSFAVVRPSVWNGDRTKW